jgi:3'-phosphoadenosine 5'-phosphosulfate (PAPS) 3'-phosphatase
MSPVGRSDHTAAESIATAAGKLLLSVRASGKSGDQLKLASHRASQEYILERLRVSFPQDASQLDGSPLRYGQADPWLPDLLICRPDLAQRVIAICCEVAVS